MTNIDRLRELAGTGAPQSTENVTGDMYKLRDVLNEAAKPDFADIDGDGDTDEDMKKAAKDKEKTDESVELDEEPNEGNEFAGKLAQARKDGKEEFEVDGKTYKVKEGKDAQAEFEREFAQSKANSKKLDQMGAEISGDAFYVDGKMVAMAIVNVAPDGGRWHKIVMMDESNDHLDEMAKFIQMAEWANSPGNQYEDRGHYTDQPEGETVDLSLRRYLDAEAHPVKVVEDHTEDGMLKEYKDFKNGN